MSDTIEEEDVLLAEDKVELQKKIDRTEGKYQMVIEENRVMLEEMKKIKELVKKINLKIE